MFLAKIFQRPHYTSDATRFLNELQRSHPQLREQQLEGVARLWDKTLDRDLLEEFSAGRVAQKPYVYEPSGH